MDAGDAVTDAADAGARRRSAALPDPLPVGEIGDDAILGAWRRVVAADAAGDDGARVEARLALIEGWLDLGGVGPAQELLREVERLTPDHPALIERRAALLSRSVHQREAAQQLSALARRRPSMALWETAVRAWIRADEVAEATTCVEALQRLAPTEPRVAAMALAVARLRSGARRGAALVEQLMERAALARRRDERDAWRALSLDAWLESHGGSGGDALSEALAATGHPRAAVYVAIESAARGLLDSGGAIDDAEALLLRAARLAESAGMPGEATASWALATLLGGARAREAREALRDLLAERGRVLELSVRLRADARRAPPNARAASWKGVAAVEMPVAPGLAAQALLRALESQPDDREAFELLRALATDAVAAEAIRDGLWAFVGVDLPRETRTRALLWLGELEEAAGDHASAAAAWAAVDEPVAAAFEGLARVHERAEELAARADAALGAVSGATPDAQGLAVEQLLVTLGAAPGAFRDLRAVTRLLGPHAGGDGRVAKLWMQVAVRQGDHAQRLAVARRVAAGCADHAVRQRAVFACVEALDTGEVGEAAELVALLLDERADEPVLAATLAALAEHGGDATLARDAIDALTRAATDPWERDVFARFSRVCAGVFEVFAACLAEPSASAERSAQLARLHDLVGDSAQLLALRTRALLAQSGAVDEGLAVARRFAAFDAFSAEAAIAWFGAASLAGDASQLAQAAVAVAASLATHRDIAAVTRTAMTRLSALGATAPAAEIALTAAAAGALGDRSLRGAVSELAARVDPPLGARLLEAVDAAAESSNERAALLRLLAERYRSSGAAGAELGAWQRLSTVAPADALPHLVRLAPRVGDRVWNAALLSQQLDATLDPAARRRLLLAVAAEYAAATPQRTVDAMAALDRLALEQREPEVRELVVGAMLSLAQTDAAIGRLTRWAAEQPDPGAVSSLLLRAARLADAGLGDPPRALALLRGLLRRDPARVDALAYAEDVAARGGGVDAMLAIYADLLDRAAGPNGRRATQYRRAVFLERVGDDAAALEDFGELFASQLAVGAPLAGIERIASRTGRHEVVLRAYDRLARAAGGTTGARLHLRASRVARDQLGDEAEALRQELLAHQADPEQLTAVDLRAAARAARERADEVARGVVEALIDEQLARGNQCWDDDERRACAALALEIGLADGVDPYRVAAAIGLYLRQHPDPGAGRAAVLELVERHAASETARAEALDAPALRAPRASSEPPPLATASEPATPEPATPEPAAPEPVAPEPVMPEPAAPEPALPESTPVDRPASVPIPEPTSSVPPPRASSPLIADASLAALRAAASHGNDAAASVLASRLSASDDLREEALAIQRRRFHEDPSRLDALEAMIALHRSLRRASEMAALTQALVTLQGRSETVVPPDLAEVAEPPDGVARVIFPARLGPFPELGVMLWEALGGARRSRERARAGGVVVAQASVLGRTFAAALRLLQLPRGTALALQEDASDAWELGLATAPPTVVLAADATADTERLRWILGYALEATRAGHLPVTALDPEEGDAWVRATALAFGPSPSARPEANVAALAGRLVDGVPARAQRRMQDLVAELGDRFSYPSWRDAVAQACASAALLTSGSFAVGARELVAASAEPVAPLSELITRWEPLRELARFATSEEYLLLRWQVDEGARRRR